MGPIPRIGGNCYRPSRSLGAGTGDLTRSLRLPGIRGGLRTRSEGALGPFSVAGVVLSHTSRGLKADTGALSPSPRLPNFWAKPWRCARTGTGPISGIGAGLSHATRSLQACMRDLTLFLWVPRVRVRQQQGMWARIRITGDARRFDPISWCLQAHAADITVAGLGSAICHIHEVIGVQSTISRPSLNSVLRETSLKPVLLTPPLDHLNAKVHKAVDEAVIVEDLRSRTRGYNPKSNSCKSQMLRQRQTHKET
jgi:hypothetical protein